MSSAEKRKEPSKKSSTNSAKSMRSAYFSEGNRSTFCNTEQMRVPQTATSNINSAMSCVELIPLEDIQSGRTFQEPAKIFSGRHPKADVIHFDTKHIVHEVPIWGVNAKHERNERFHDPNPWRRHGCVQKLHEIGGWISQGEKHVRKTDRKYKFVEAGSTPPISPNAPLFNSSEAGTSAAINAFRGMPAVLHFPAERGRSKSKKGCAESEGVRVGRGQQQFREDAQPLAKEELVNPKSSDHESLITGRHYNGDKKTGRKSKKNSSRQSKRSKKSERERSSRTVSRTRTQSTQSVSRFVSPLSVEGRSQRKNTLKMREPISDCADTLYGIPSIRPKSVRIAQEPADAIENLQRKMENLSAETALMPTVQIGPGSRKSAATSTVTVNPETTETTSSYGTTTLTGTGCSSSAPLDSK